MIANLLACAGCAYAATKVWALYRAGHDSADAVTAVVCVLGVCFATNAYRGYRMTRRVRKAHKATRRIRKTQGRARWGTNTDAKRARMNRKGGYFIGELDGVPRYYNGQGSVFCFAPPGTGKTTSSSIMQLLRPHRDERGRPVSMFVLDLKLELYAVTARRLRRLGYRVVLLCPWAERMSRELRIDLEDTGFNPFLPLLTAGDETKDYAELLAELMLPGSKNMSGSSQFFLDFGREILTWGMLCLARLGDPARVNPVELRRLLMMPGKEFDDLLAETCFADEFGGALRQYANKLAETKLNASEEWSGAINTATKAMRVYDELGPLGKHCSAVGGFDFSTIKDRPTVVFLGWPAERTSTHAPWINAVTSVAIEQIARDRSTKRVMCLFDEFANAGYLPGVIKALGLYRSQGLQFVFYAQTASQIIRIYGSEGLRDFMGMCAVIQAFAVRDPETLRTLSELGGHETVRSVSHNVQADLHGHNGGAAFSSGSSAQGRPLVRIEEIRTLPDDKQLVFVDNKPPFLMEKVSYLSRRRWRRHADPNPYYA